MTYEEALYWHTHNGATMEQERESELLIKEALEKQIPKKVKDILCNKKQKGGYCPTCGGTVVIENSFLRKLKDNHCSWCGQKLSWIGGMKNDG